MQANFMLFLRTFARKNQFPDIEKPDLSRGPVHSNLLLTKPTKTNRFSIKQAACQTLNDMFVLHLCAGSFH